MIRYPSFCLAIFEYTGGMWSLATYSMWGKSGPPPLPLVEHLLDTEAVAELLWDQYLSPHTKAYFTRALGSTESQVRAALLFLASIHDVGKATPVFQIKVEPLAQVVRSHGLACEEVVGEALRQRSHHSLTGQVIVERWLADVGADVRWADVIGAHHGKGQDNHILYGAPRQPAYTAYSEKLLGGEGWNAVQTEILAHFWDTYGEDALPVFRTSPSSPVLMLLTGIVIYADWLASSEENFSGADLSDPWRRDNGVQRIHIPDSWNPAAAPEFEKRFGYAPYGSQQAIADLMAEKEDEGLWIIESSMGTGKTESALLGAEILAHKFGLHGCVFALPNRASANAVFSRFVDWMDALPGEDLNASAPVYLAHGKAQLNETYTGLSTRETDVDGEVAARYRVARFFQNPKTFPLTPMMVSTVDHVIMAGLDAKHQMLRHIAFSGKVIIVDEVHAYDAFMNTFLDHALEAFGEYRIPVILLSATLPPRRRQELVEAYSRKQVSANVSTETGYPLVTYASHRGDAETHAFPSPKKSLTYAVAHCQNSVGEVMEAAQETLEQGGNVLVIRNTVKRAVETHEAFLEAGVDSLLFHSRFLPADRERIENELTRRFSSRVGDREAGKVVVATQVAEQSLDLDFDHLITDLAPVDLVLQRLGRVFRNTTVVRAVSMAKVTIIDLSTEGKFALFPYQEWTMNQASWVLRDLGEVQVPEQVPMLVRQAYEEDKHPDLKKKFLAKEVGSQRTAEVSALSLASGKGLLGVGKNNPDENKVRDIKDQEEVIILEEVQGELRIPSWFPDHLLPGADVSRKQRDLYKALNGCSLSVRLPLLSKAMVQRCQIAVLTARDTLVIILRKKDDCWVSGTLSYSPDRGLL